ncbi:MAG TPA: PAS domain-containing protein [Azospirillaceae bacterium]|nr:PAS domain-containing protein [Azospirillaceae bacterium]
MDIENAQLAGLLALWETVRDGRPLPARREFRAEDFQPWFGHIGIIELHDGPKRLYVRLAGTAINRYDGRDFTGRYLEDCLPPEVHATMLAPYERCRTERAPVACTMDARALKGAARRLDRLLLPCGDGERVDSVIVGMYAAGHQRSRVSLYGGDSLASAALY